MPMQALQTTLAILLFRAGPQDFPYSEQPQLMWTCQGVAVAACALFFGLSMPPVAALVAAVIAVAGLSMFTRVLLRIRKFDNRYAQTLNALLAVGSVLLVALTLPMSQLMPQMKTYLELVQQNPELANDPASLPKLPAGPVLIMDVLAIWFFAVTAHIFRQAAEVGFFGGAMIALLCQFNLMMFLLFTAPLIALFAH